MMCILRQRRIYKNNFLYSVMVQYLKVTIAQPALRSSSFCLWLCSRLFVSLFTVSARSSLTLSVSFLAWVSSSLRRLDSSFWKSEKVKKTPTNKYPFDSFVPFSCLYVLSYSYVSYSIAYTRIWLTDVA